jgi:hypothetical protein
MEAIEVSREEVLKSRRVSLLAKRLGLEFWILDPGHSGTLECHEDVDLEMVLRAVQEFMTLHGGEGGVKIQRIGSKELFVLQVLKHAWKIRPS